MAIARPLMIVLSLFLLACAPSGSGNPEAGAGSAGDAPVIEASPPASAQRTAPAIVPVEDLRVPAEGADPPFFYPGQLAVDGDGRMLVLDEADQTVKLLDSAGRLEAEIAGEGQGPGELSAAVAAMTVAGDRLLVADAILARLSAWDLADLGFAPVPIAAGDGMIADAIDLAGLADGSFVVLYSRLDVEGASRSQAVHIATDGTLLSELFAMPERFTTIDLGGRAILFPVAAGQNQIAVTPAGDLYATGGDRYEVDAVAADGTPRWRLRVDWPRAPMPDAEVERAFDAVAGMMRAMGQSPELDRAAIDGLPETLPALQAIKLDGVGRLWVFPYVYSPLGEEPPRENWPVDVYDDAGTLLYSGTMPARFALHPARGGAWITAAGDHVYGFDTGPDGNRVLVRHRLDLPEPR